MLFQAGLVVACLGAVSGWWETAVAVIAPAYIVTLMYLAGRSADREQESRYGASAEWQAYRARSGAFRPRPGAAAPLADDAR
jgi:hypothetical protein